MYNTRNTNWLSKLDDFGREVINRLGEIPGDRNPVTFQLKNNPNFISEIENIPGYSMIGMSKLATACQMMVYDRKNGPEGDNKCKALRRHWYAWYKVDFAQPYSKQIAINEVAKVNEKFAGESKNSPKYLKAIKSAESQGNTNDPTWGLNWAGRLSQTYAWYVDNANVTYKDLWVEDASRMIQRTYDRLFKNFHVILAVEKDSLHADFIQPAERLGFRSIVSGKGKMGKAATEKVLRDHFGWISPDQRYEWQEEVFTAENPLYIIHLSDYDFDGEAVIGPTFGEQARRYTPHVVEARIGIDPSQVKDITGDWEDTWYSVKVSNSGYRLWVDNKALFDAECLDCGHTYVVMGKDDEQTQPCPECGGDHYEITDDDVPHGFEVEALTTYDYYDLIVDALLHVIKFDEIVSRLRDECRPNVYSAAERIRGDIVRDNEDYQNIQAEIDRLQAILNDFDEEIEVEISEKGNEIVEDQWDDFRDLEDDPEPDDMKEHTRSGYGVWRPFSESVRTDKLVEILEEEKDDFIQDLKNREIDW